VVNELAGRETPQISTTESCPEDWTSGQIKNKKTAKNNRPQSIYRVSNFPVEEEV